MRSRMRVGLSVVLVLVFALSFAVSTAIGGPYNPPKPEGCCVASLICADGKIVRGWGEEIDKYTCVSTPWSYANCGMPPFCKNINIP
jgi:hypothetical protein